MTLMRLPRAALAEVPAGIWSESVVHEEPGRSCRWLRIVDLPRITLGASDDGVWVRKNNGTVSRFETERELVFLLPAIEIGYRDLVDILERSLVKLGLPAQLAKAFPFVALVKTGLEAKSAHWTPLAMAW